MKAFFVRSFFALATLLCASQTFAAQKIAYIFSAGQGSDVGSSDTQFQKSTSSFYKIRELGWQIHPFFGAAGSPTRAQMQTALGQTIAPLTDDTFNKAHDQLLQQINQGQIKAGDKVLIIIDTHGSNAYQDDLGWHLGVWSTSDDEVPREAVTDVIQAAEKHGVQIALIDTSCFGGESIHLATAKTCVVTDTSAENYGYSNVAAMTASNLLPSKLSMLLPNRRYDLESIFLRVDHKVNYITYGVQPYVDQMQISTAPGLAILNLLKPFEVAGSIQARKEGEFGLDDTLLIKESDLQKLHSALVSANLNHTAVIGSLFYRYSPDKIMSQFEQYDVLAKKFLAEQNGCAGNSCPTTATYYDLMALSNSLHESEHFIYRHIYIDLEKQMSNKPNACRDFSL